MKTIKNCNVNIWRKFLVRPCKSSYHRVAQTYSHCTIIYRPKNWDLLPPLAVYATSTLFPLLSRYRASLSSLVRSLFISAFCWSYSPYGTLGSRVCPEPPDLLFHASLGYRSSTHHLYPSIKGLHEPPFLVSPLPASFRFIYSSSYP